MADTVSGYQKEWNINGETVVLGVEKEISRIKIRERSRQWLAPFCTKTRIETKGEHYEKQNV